MKTLEICLQVGAIKNQLSMKNANDTNCQMHSYLYMYIHTYVYDC